ncbi:MAG: MBL fold metallo-hydrolase [Hyphomicrobiales bacterium]|nr:MBL fold metallo-hydrolase [Hyphomicrobiales bacterium]
MSARLTIIGSGDAFGAGGRMQSCCLIEHGGQGVLLDCGATSLVALKRQGVSLLAFDTVLITHLHGDHFGGLPFLLIDWIYVSKRVAPVVIAGPPGIEARFWAACETLYPIISQAPRRFEMLFLEIAPGERATVSGMAVQAFEMKHFSGAPSLAYRMTMDEIVFAFTGDSGWCDAVTQAGQGADLYLMECYQYDLVLDMHLDFQTIHSRRDSLGAKRIMLTHMSEAMLARADEARALGYLLAEDGLVIDI